MRIVFLIFVCASAVLSPAAAVEEEDGVSTGPPSGSTNSAMPAATPSPADEITTTNEADHSTTEQRDSTLLHEEIPTAEVKTATTGTQDLHGSMTTSIPEIVLGEPELQEVYTLGKINRTSPPSLLAGSCGSRGRIIGGLLAAVGAWPWAVAVRDKHNTHYCGGVLISSRHILTAAHCIDHPDLVDRLPLRVTVGDYDLSTDDESDSTTEWVHQAFRHSQYNQPTLYNNDIGVLVVEHDIDDSADVNHVCLPDAQLDLPVGTEVSVIGWGATVDNGPVVNELRQVKLTILDNSRCSAAYNEFQADRMYCVGDLTGNKDACQGDSGGPMLYRAPNSDNWQVVGVVSFGSACASAQYPGVYSSVPFHRGLVNWALQNT